MKSKQYAYKYIRNGEYAIYVFYGELEGEYYHAPSYTVYTTKQGGKTGSKLFVNQDIRFYKDSVYNDLEELLEDIEIQYTNKLSYIRKELVKWN